MPIDKSLCVCFPRDAHPLKGQRVTRVERATFSLEGCNASNVNADGISTYDNDVPHWASDWVQLLQNDAELAKIVEQWPNLSEAIKLAIIAMVNATGTQKK